MKIINYFWLLKLHLIVAWIFDIVANKRNSIDVDKFDYLQRDAYHIGYKDSSFDYKTIMKNSLIIDGEICYNSKVTIYIYKAKFY